MTDLNMTNFNQTVSPRKKNIRNVLLFGGVAVVLAVVAWFYLTSGRYASTDNAYVKTSKIMLTPEVSGVIDSVSVKDNQEVALGAPLLTIDARPYQFAVEKAEADLASVESHIGELKAEYRQKLAAVQRADVDADYAKQEYNRRVPLQSRGVVSVSELAEYKRANNMNEKNVSVLQEELSQIVAELGGDAEIDPKNHSSYRAAAAALSQARLNLEHTKIVSPVKGIISTAPRIGDYARAGVPLTNMVSTDESWIEANFKETELTDVVPGQPVVIEVDMYPDREWTGVVQSISPATGAEFSLLPPQNATGNWVKVIQRIAVHIAVDPNKDAPPLRAGMSTTVKIDLKADKRATPAPVDVSSKAQ